MLGQNFLFYFSLLEPSLGEKFLQAVTMKEKAFRHPRHNIGTSRPPRKRYSDLGGGLRGKVPFALIKFKGPLIGTKITATNAKHYIHRLEECFISFINPSLFRLFFRIIWDKEQISKINMMNL